MTHSPLGPATKRFVSNSPLGKKGCECKHCGKVLHNQGMDGSSYTALFFSHFSISLYFLVETPSVEFQTRSVSFSVILLEVAF